MQSVERRLTELEAAAAAIVARVDADLDEFERLLVGGELPPFPGWDWPAAGLYVAEVDATYTEAQKARALELARRWAGGEQCKA